MRNPTAFLLGAGASLPYGIPMMAGFYEQFGEHLLRRHPQCVDLVGRFEAKTRPRNPDLETLLEHIQRVLSLPEALAALGAESDDLAAQVSLTRELKGFLDAFIVDACQRFDRRRAEREIGNLCRLRRFGPLWVFSTNYDLIIEHVCEQLKLPHADGFEAPLGQPVSDWTGRFENDVRVVKLHGSINWFEDEPGGDTHRLDRGYALPTADFRLTRGEQSLKPLMIIPTLEKEALGPPYQKLATIFSDTLSKIRLLVIAGSSLRDVHIREHVTSRLTRLHVLIVSPNASHLKNVFRKPDRTHPLSVGFSEFLTVTWTRFEQLLDRLVETDGSDDADAAAVEEFVADASQGIQAEETLKGQPELYGLIKDLRSDQVANRADAALKLGAHPHPSVISRLRDVLCRDPEPAVRVNAATALFRVQGAGAVDVFQASLERDSSPIVQLEVVLALGKVGSHEAQAVLRGVRDLQKIQTTVRTVVAELIGSDSSVGTT